MHSSVAYSLSTTILLAQADAESESQSVKKIDEMLVVGFSKSLADARKRKRNADRVIDSIQSEDISKLPDVNVSEALQRITGLQIDRDSIGDGERFQVRGLSQNRVEINGRTLSAAGNDDSTNNVGDSRGSVLNTTASALFRSIEVIKTPTADMIEGSLGATINLKTFKPLDFKTDNTLNLSGDLIDQELADDNGYNIKALYSTQFETGLGEMGFLVNADISDKNTIMHDFDIRMQPIRGNQADYPNLQDSTVFRPHRGGPGLEDVNVENQGIDISYQWRLNDDVELFIQGTHTNNERTTNSKSNTHYPQKNRLRFTGAPEVDSFEWVSTSDPADPFFVYTNAGSAKNPSWQAAPGVPVRRGLIRSGSLRSSRGVFDNQRIAEFTGQYQLTDEEQTAFTVGLDWKLGDRIFAKADYSRSEATFFRNNVFTTFQPMAFAPNAKNPGVGSDREMQANFIWDYGTGTDLPTYRLDFTDVNTELLASGSAGPTAGPVDLDSLNFFTINELGGRFDNKTAIEDAVRIDFDWDIDDTGITSVEFGLRVARQQRDRDRTRYGAVDPTLPASSETVGNTVNWRTMSTLSDEWINNDGDPSTGLVTRDQVFLPELIAAGVFPEGTVVAPTGDFVFQDFSGDFVRRWPTSTITDINYYLRIAQEYFPGRIANPGPDGRYCNAVSNGNNAPAGQANDYTAYYNDPNNADANFVDCRDDVRAINGFGIREFIGYAFDLEEIITAAYIKMNYEGDWGVPVSGNIGVRLVNTDFEASAFDDISQTFTTLNKDYDNVLPSLNLNFSLLETMNLRLGLSKALARPDPDDMVPRRDLNAFGTVETRGNPDLKPLEADQADLSWEWYFNDNSLISATYYYKKLTNTIVGSRASLPPQADTDGDGIINENDMSLEIRSNTNEPGGTIKGYEIAYETVFDALPSPFDGFGVQANYTHADSEQTGGIHQLTGGTLPIDKQSDNSYNFILFWEKWNWSVRAAYNYRDWSLNGDSPNRADLQGYAIVDPALTASAQAADPNADAVITAWNVDLPQYQDDLGQIDMEVSYRWNDFTFSINARDINADARTQSFGFPNSIYSADNFQYTGTTYRAGVRYKLAF